jgi:uncharacterized protein YuzE
VATPILHIRVRQPDVTADYDRAADVLYLMRGSLRPVEGTGLAGGVELDYSLDDGSPCGVTVVGFRRNGWHERPDELAEIAGGHLAESKDKLAKAIKRAAC